MRLTILGVVHILQPPSLRVAWPSNQMLLACAEFGACLSDQALQDKITTVARGGTIAGVTSTPTFFINGKKYQGYMTPEAFGEIVDR